MAKASAAFIFSTPGADEAARDMGRVHGSAARIGEGAKHIEKVGVSWKKMVGSIVSGQIIAQAAMAAFRQAVSGITGIFRAAIDAAASIEEYRISLAALKGGQEEATIALEHFREVASQVPFSLDEVISAGTTLERFGADSKKWLGPIADLAAFMGTSIPEAAGAFGRAFAAGAGAADILRERGVLTAIALRTGLEDLTKLTLPEFREAMFDAMTDPDGKIAGTTKELAETWTGQISMLADSWFNLKVQLGQELLPVLKSIVGVLREELTSETIDHLVEAFKGLFRIGLGVAQLLAGIVMQVLAVVQAARTAWNIITLDWGEAYETAKSSAAMAAGGMRATARGVVAIGGGAGDIAESGAGADVERIFGKVVEKLDEGNRDRRQIAEGADRRATAVRPAMPPSKE